MLTFLLLQSLTTGTEPAENADIAQTPAPVAEAVNAVDVSVLDLLIEGGWYIMLPLAVMSVVALYVFFERLMAIRNAEKVAPDFMNKIKDYVSSGNFASARNLCATSNTPMARMLDKGISRIGKDLKDISVAIENIGKLEIYSLEKNLGVLATVAGAAPMLGFLGTVIGMVNVFLQMEQAGTVRVEDISGGTKQAMITTIVGLIVGIIAYMAYNHLVSKVSKVINKMEATTIEFIDILEEPAK
jgi:biopolymer transport protein ExbB